ncbi:hypothetical protein SD77_2363 [Bacillus badius]|uniref:Ribose 5-phosphate isomerase B n=1 Tax=Bacillus badius TaxID=1455 RepID=A0ABR5AYU7_BACBA|nr:hypothetical protein SD77_2363 [Bacillus badius]
MDQGRTFAYFIVPAAKRQTSAVLSSDTARLHYNNIFFF